MMMKHCLCKSEKLVEGKNNHPLFLELPAGDMVIDMNIERVQVVILDVCRGNQLRDPPGKGLYPLTWLRGPSYLYGIIIFGYFHI